MANPEFGPAGSPSLRARVKVTYETGRLNKLITNYVRMQRRDLDALVRTTGLDLVKRIQARTPVDTGRARASIHAVFYGEDPTFTYKAENPIDPALGDVTYDGTLDTAPTLIGTAVIGSNVEYMPNLEAGWSRQAPEGMFRIVIAEYRQSFAKKLIEILAAQRRVP